MTTYRRKDVPTIEARQLEHAHSARTEMIQWIKSVSSAEEFDYNDETWPRFGVTTDPADGSIILALPGGYSGRATPGDYVCRSSRGQLFVRSASAIRDTYEEVHPTPDPVHEQLEAVSRGHASMFAQLAEEAQRLLDEMEKRA